MKPIKELESPSLLNNLTLFADINIVICDADNRIANLVRNILGTLGCNRLTLVADGQSVLDLMKTERVDIIITDWHAKNISGIELVKHLRQSLDSPNRMVPVIMLTGHNERNYIEEARDAGITEYLVKPFSAKSLLDRIYTTVTDPRSFILCKSYVGPDRRRLSSMTLPPDPDVNREYFERRPPVIVEKDTLQQVLLDDMPRMILPDYTMKKKIGFEVHADLINNPLTVAKSEEEIAKVQEEFVTSMMKDVETMRSSYNILIMSHDNVRSQIKNLEEAAYSIKSRAGIFGYVRATEVANQLYNFCKRYYDKDNVHHLIILEKHVQTLGVIFAQKITGDGGDIGRDLMIDLARLINKYLNRPQ